MGTMFMHRVKGDLSTLIAPAAFFLLASCLCVSRSAVCLSVCQLFQFRLQSGECQSKPGKSLQGSTVGKEANPEESAPPQGNSLACVIWYHLGRVGSCDMMLRLEAHCQHLCFQPRQLLIAYG